MVQGKLRFLDDKYYIEIPESVVNLYSLKDGVTCRIRAKKIGKKVLINLEIED